jgi:hypothetical protein
MMETIRLVLIVGLLGRAAYASVLTLETSPAALGANDTVNWTQLGGDSTALGNSFSATSTNSDFVTGFFSTSTGEVVDVGASWGPASGSFSNGDSVIWANDGTNGTGPLTFTFPSVFGVGASIQADQPGQFTAQIQLFHLTTSLGTESLTSDSAGDAIFIGALDSVNEVTKAVFSLTAVTAGDSYGNALGDFAVDTLNLKEAVSAAPEPGSVFLLFGGLAGLSLLRRRFRRA